MGVRSVRSHTVLQFKLPIVKILQICVDLKKKVVKEKGENTNKKGDRLNKMHSPGLQVIAQTTPCTRTSLRRKKTKNQNNTTTTMQEH